MLEGHKAGRVVSHAIPPKPQRKNYASTSEYANAYVKWSNKVKKIKDLVERYKAQGGKSDVLEFSDLEKQRKRAKEIHDKVFGKKKKKK